MCSRRNYMASKGPTVLPPMETGKSYCENVLNAILNMSKGKEIKIKSGLCLPLSLSPVPPFVLSFSHAETSAAATQTSSIPVAKQPEPMFVAVPPRPSRVLHSDAYLR